jgi:AcrR family transcriptional regulator
MKQQQSGQISCGRSLLSSRPAAPMRNRDRQKGETRKRILASAVRVFGRKGILASTTAEIAEDAGLSHGSVFVHFGTQEALIAAVIDEFGDTLAGRIHELAARGAGTREVLEAHLRGLAEREDFYTRLVIETPLLPLGARSSLVLVQSALSFHFAPAIDADAKRGSIKVMPLHLLFNTWIGLVHYYLANRELFAPGSSVIECRGEELVDHFMSLISNGG